MSFITACSLVSAEVILYSLRGLVSVKKDGLSIGVLDSCQVLSSIVPAVSITSCTRALQAVLILFVA